MMFPLSLFCFSEFMKVQVSFLFVGAMFAACSQPRTSIDVKITNKLDTLRSNELVEIPFKQVIDEFGESDSVQFVIVDKDGKVTGYSIETVYTPFKKSDIEVTVEKGALTVKCGGKTEESGESKDKTMNHCSISYQAYEFTLPLTEDVDMEKISAEAEDGMLRITLPLKEIVQKEEKPLKIEVK